MRHLPHTLATRCALVAALLTAPAVALAAPASAAPSAAPVSKAAAGGEAPPADFDGDGYGDVVASAPGNAQSGYLAVRYGGPGQRHQTIDAVNARTAARDLDRDGYTDLVSGTDIYWGAPGGLGARPTAFPASVGVNGTAVTGGDFNGDGAADLVIGKTDGEWGDLRVLYGPFTRDGLPAATSELPTGRTFEPTDLVVGDVTGDGTDDLVTLHAFEEMSESSQFWKGGAQGLTTTSVSIPDAASATIGDVDADGYGDLVIRTVPNGVVEDLPYDYGTVKVLYGTASGPSKTRTTTITQNTAGVPGVNEDGDQFGYALASGDVDDDGVDDVVVGVAYEDLEVDGKNLKDAGSVVVLKGSRSGLSGAGARSFHQNTAGVPGVAEAGDLFGSRLYVTDLDGDGPADLTVSAPGEDTSAADAGAVWQLPGTPSGLTGTGSTAFNPDDLGAPAKGSRLGAWLAR